MKLYKIVSLSAPVEEPIGVLLTGGVVAGHQNISISTKVTSSVTLKVLSHSGLKETVLVDLWLLKKGFVWCTNSIPSKGEKELRDPNGEMLFRSQQSPMLLADTAETRRYIPAFRVMHHIAAVPTWRQSSMDPLRRNLTNSWSPKMLLIFKRGPGGSARL